MLAGTAEKKRPRVANRFCHACSVAVLFAAGCAQPMGPLFSPTPSAKIWPRPPEIPRIRFVGSLSSSRDLHAGVSSREAWAAAFRGPRPPIRFQSPHSVAINPSELLAVTDIGGASVHIIDLNARTHLVVRGWDDERFGVPIGVTWVGRRLFVTDAKRHEVIELDVDGGVRQRFGTDVLVRPVGITYVESRGTLCVVDGGAHGLRMFTLSGNLEAEIGVRGSQPGEFDFPSHVVAGADRLVVADSGNARVQVLDLDGNPITTIGHRGNAAGDMSLPKGVAVDASGHIYVVDAHFEAVQIFDPSGQLLMFFGQEGAGDGEFSLPAGLAIDHQNRIWIADALNHRVQVFQLTEGRTAVD